MIRYLLALLVTLGVEALVVAALTRGPQRALLVRVSFFVNLSTHPLANLFYAGTAPSFAALEMSVVLVEAFLYAIVAGSGFGRATLLSLAANVASLACTVFFPR